MHTISMAHAGQPGGSVLPGCPPARQGKSIFSPGAAAPGQILTRDSSRLQPHQTSLAHQPGNTWEMPQPSAWQAGGPWEEPQLPAPAGRMSPSLCPASQPSPGLPGSEHMPTACGCQGPALPGGGPLSSGWHGWAGELPTCCPVASAQSVLAQARRRRACRSNTTV